MLFTIEFREIKNDDSIVKCQSFIISSSAKTFVHSDGHTFFREAYHPKIIPVNPIISLSFMEKFILEFKTDSVPKLDNLDDNTYNDMPNDKWIQLNTSQDKFTIQAKIKKMPITKAIFSEKSNTYSVYAVVGIALHINNVVENKNDKDKLLAI